MMMIELNRAINDNLQPIIICVAESTHYLVGVLDANDNLIGLNNTVRSTSVNSLAQAKKYLREQHIEQALLEYQSAYDEMCGLPSNDRYIQTIRL